MDDIKKLTVNLSVEQGAYVAQQLARGAYFSANDVAAAGLKALQDADSLDHWLHEDVAPVFDAMQADPGRAVSADAVLESLRTRHAAGVAGKRGA